jgi:hypothetical protein
LAEQSDQTCFNPWGSLVEQTMVPMALMVETEIRPYMLTVFQSVPAEQDLKAATLPPPMREEAGMVGQDLGVVEAELALIPFLTQVLVEMVATAG